MTEVLKKVENPCECSDVSHEQPCQHEGAHIHEENGVRYWVCVECCYGNHSNKVSK